MRKFISYINSKLYPSPTARNSYIVWTTEGFMKADTESSTNRQQCLGKAGPTDKQSATNV